MVQQVDEEETTLKKLRLRYLDLAGTFLIQGQYDKVFECLSNFKDTVSKTDVCYPILDEAFNQVLTEVTMAKEWNDHKTTGRILEDKDIRFNRYYQIQHEYLRRLHGICFDIAIQYDLIEKQK